MSEENENNALADMYGTRKTAEPAETQAPEPEVQETEAVPAAEVAETAEPEVKENEVTEAKAKEPETAKAEEPEVKENEVTEIKVEEPEAAEAETSEPEVQETAVTTAPSTEGEGTEETAEKPKREPSQFVGGFVPAIKGLISFFTIFRLNVGEKEQSDMESNFWLVPIVGLLLGLIVFTECFILGLLQFDTMAQAAIALGTVYVLSKFLHFDGLVDFGDGMVCSSADREKHVHALKDTNIGAGGLGVALITIILAILLLSDVAWSAEFGFWLTLGDNPNGWFVSVAFVALGLEILVKNAMVAAAAFGNPGTGMAAHQVECTGKDALIKSTVLTSVLIAIIGGLYYVFAKGSATGVPFISAVVVILIVLGIAMSVFSGWLMARMANRTFGFVNGDVLGATNEIARVIILFVSCIVIGAAT